jgi:hypothetical protein
MADKVADVSWAQRTLVRTWAMRGALHLLVADELACGTAGCPACGTS